MSLRDLNHAPVKVIPRGEGSTTLSEARDVNDDAETALQLVMEKAAAIREFERETTQALSHARDIAADLKEQLDDTEARAERAETMLRLAEGQVEGLTADVEQARHDVRTLQALLAARGSRNWSLGPVARKRPRLPSTK